MAAYMAVLTVWVDAERAEDAAEVALGTAVEGARRILSRCDAVKLADADSEQYARSTSQVLDQALESAAAVEAAGMTPARRTRPQH
jgi:hypothetical protein